MLVTYHLKNKDGQCFKTINKLSVNDAKLKFEALHKKDDNIIEVWLTYFRGWHNYHYKTLKDIQ